MPEKIPITTLNRTSKILTTISKIGVKKVLSVSKRPFLSKKSQIQEKDKIDNEIANILFVNISLLKGTAVKITQALSLHNILPRNIQNELSKSYNQIKPINQAMVMVVLKNEFKQNYLEIFNKFNLKAFASASLGQVHLAYTVKNKKVAVKIQYPSIDKTIKNDINLIKKFSKFNKNIELIIQEIEEKLYEEIDYTKELENNIWAYDSFNNIDNIIVPKVYKKYSTKHILTTSYIDGLDLYLWLNTNPKQKYKQKIANNIFSIFTKSIFKFRKIQADPNPANYIVTPENNLALIDFGCVESFDEKFIKNYINVFKVYKTTNKTKILNIYKIMGLIKNIDDISNDIFENKILPFNKWAIKPFLTDEYKFTKDYLDEGVKYADIFTNKPFSIAPDFIFLDRTLHGLYSLFEQMDVVIDIKEFREYLGFR